ncbi:hypothetical protein BXA18_22355, partial [Acinetobacter baumannii]
MSAAPLWLVMLGLFLAISGIGLSDIDDRFSVRIMNLIYTYIGFFITAASVQLLFPYPLICTYLRCLKWPMILG